MQTAAREEVLIDKNLLSGDYCRDIGALKQWTKKQSDDPIFKAYRKEYKKRFAWIKAGRITDEAFYAWSKKARE